MKTRPAISELYNRAMLRKILALVLGLVFTGCAPNHQVGIETEDEIEEAGPPSRPVALENDKFLEEDGISYLWAGEDDSQHFVVDNLVLKPEQFHYGIGREEFPALIEPHFISAQEADSWLADSARVLGLRIGDEIKAYPIELLTRHEVVNDVVGGEPIFAAYCILADLGAVYSRRIDGRVHTFALSGYTYFDPEVWDGMDGFVLWDRETESLWWPLIGEAVSGPLLHTPMDVYDQTAWSQTTWEEWKAQYPTTVVLERDQDFERPATWPRYEIQPSQEGEDSETGVAPRWGDNAGTL